MTFKLHPGYFSEFVVATNEFEIFEDYDDLLFPNPIDPDRNISS